MVEWDVEVISRPFSLLKWDVYAAETTQIRQEWKRFYHIPSDLVVDRWASMLRAAQTLISCFYRHVDAVWSPD